MMPRLFQASGKPGWRRSAACKRRQRLFEFSLGLQSDGKVELHFGNVRPLGQDAAVYRFGIAPTTGIEESPALRKPFLEDGRRLGGVSHD